MAAMNMMSTCVDDLFKQIISSEEKAREKKNNINEVKQQNAEYLKKLKEAEDDLKSHQGQIVVKVEQLNEAELQLRWATSKLNQLTEQRDVLKREQEQLTATLADLEVAFEKRREAFCDHAWGFAQDNDLCSLATIESEARVAQEVMALEKQEKQLLQEISVLQREEDDADKVRKEFTSLQIRVQEKKQQKHELEKQIVKEEGEYEKLERERQATLAAPQNNQEFKRLRQELEQCGDDSLEMICTALRQELYMLQQERQRKPASTSKQTVSSHSDVPAHGGGQQSQWTMWTRNSSRSTPNTGFQQTGRSNQQ